MFDQIFNLIVRSPDFVKKESDSTEKIKDLELTQTPAIGITDHKNTCLLSIYEIIESLFGSVCKERLISKIKNY
jgi:hypothetical protein